MNKRFFLMVCGLAAMAAGGCGQKKMTDPVAVRCPEKTVRMLQINQRFVDSVVPGETPVKGLKKLKGIRRWAVLEKPGEAPLDVAFLQTGLPTCPWVVASESLTPLVVKDGVIVKLGTQRVRDMAAEGWVIKGAAWPWQRYDFGYIPTR